MRLFDPYLPIEGATRLYYRGIGTITSEDSATTLPLFMEWLFAHHDFAAPAARPQPPLRAVIGGAGPDPSMHFLPAAEESVFEPIRFQLHAMMASGYAEDFMRFISFESPVCDVSFDAHLRDWSGGIEKTFQGDVFTLPSTPPGYHFLNIERLYRKPDFCTNGKFGKRYTGCTIDAGDIQIAESGKADGQVHLYAPVVCWGDIQSLSTFTPGMNIFRN